MLYVCPTRGPLDCKGVYAVVSMCLQLMIRYSTCLIWAEKLFVKPRDGAPSFQPQFQKKSIATKNLTRGWPKHQSSPTGLLKSAGWRNGKKKKRVWTPSRTSWKNLKCIYYRLQHRQNPQKTTTWRWAQLKIDAKISKWTLEWTHQGDQKRAGHKNEDSTVFIPKRAFWPDDE